MKLIIRLASGNRHAATGGGWQHPLRHAATLAAAATLAVAPLGAHAHRGDAPSALSTLSALPVASVVVAGVGASSASASVAALPVALSVGGAVLIVQSVEVSGRITLCVLERASDGARVSLEIASRGIERSALSVGQSVTVSALASGTLLSAAGEVIAFLPNALGRALLHDERLTD